MQRTPGTRQKTLLLNYPEMALVSLGLVLMGCGRIGYDVRSPDGSDAGAVPDVSTDDGGHLDSGSIPTNADASVPLSACLGSLSSTRQVAAGAEHTCALLVDGRVKCWGQNTSGQGGNSMTATQLSPVEVAGISPGIDAIAAGGSHTCAHLDDGSVECWGKNTSGQLGANTPTDHVAPVEVAPLRNQVETIAAGGMHTCALLKTGGVQCWGKNDLGQLGDGTYASRSTPSDVLGLTSGATQISTGLNHSCALLEGGTVQCWGANSRGQLGNGSITSPLVPTNVDGLTSDVTAIRAGGEHTCAILKDGGARCWGYNVFGQLGDGSTVNRLSPVPVLGLATEVADITIGRQHSCARMVDGTVWCWGLARQGQLGGAAVANSTTPMPVIGLSAKASEISAGSDHTCARLENGQVECWGRNGSGQLGNASTSNRLTPTLRSGLPREVNRIAIHPLGEHQCALLETNGIKCWGDNSYGQLGDGTTSLTLSPVDVTGLTAGVADIQVGQYYTCALTSVGGVKCWGRGSAGQLGDGSFTDRYTPVDVSGMSTGAVAIAVGEDHACAIRDVGTVFCWGNGDVGSLGNGRAGLVGIPVMVNGLGADAVAVTAGDSSTCALLKTGRVQCWGSNFTGQLGDGTTSARFAPVDVVGLSSTAVSLEMRRFRTCAVLDSGGVQCWGLNSMGQLGDGTTTARLTPVDVEGLRVGVRSVHLGLNHSCALLDTGGIKCWGATTSFPDGAGLLGDGTELNRLTPVDVVGLSSDAIFVATGSNLTCAVLDDRTVECWGDDSSGMVTGRAPGQPQSVCGR
jgi:alpha-tubulin suppressor-like RCC1 family protein